MGDYLTISKPVLTGIYIRVLLLGMGSFFIMMCVSGAILIGYYGADSVPGMCVVLLIGGSVALLIPISMKFKFMWDRAVAKGNIV